MNLIDYCTTHGGTGTTTCPVLRSLADSAGCSPQTLYLILLGHKKAGRGIASNIEQATAGAVTRADLRPDWFAPLDKAA